ncbi:MAG: thiamine phosphate synthase [Bacteroidia bacterium]
MDKKISHLQYITQDVIGMGHPELASHACSAGIDWVQLRIKNRTYNELLDIAIKTEMICRKYHAKLIVNDNVNIAKTIKADGVHLGKTDMDPKEARALLGNNFIIGGTANTFEDIERLVNAGVDYIGLGPFRFTTTKENISPILGLEGYTKIIEECRKNKITIPIIAIGGIKVEDVKPLMETGVYGVAVSSAINKAENITETAKRFINKIKFEIGKR